MKKLISLLLALMMVFSLAFTAIAAETEKGSITINGVSTGTQYAIYKLLDLESYDKNSGQGGLYVYKVNDVWDAFFETDAAKEYFTVDAQGYANWVGDDSDARVAAFAKLALEYAKDEAHPITPVKTTEDLTITETTGVFSNLELGYYLVDSSVGALCGLTTTNPDASVNAKNKRPTIEKAVQEDSTSQYIGQNTADIGQIVEFRTTINVHAGPENYVVHDTMDNSLTFVQNSDTGRGVHAIQHIIPGVTDAGDSETLAGTPVPAEYYKIITDCEDGCDFEIHFTKEFCEHLQANDKVIIYYNAMLNRDAVISGTGNTNKTWMDYGDDQHTAEVETKTYTFSIDIVKTDGQFELITGAEFEIYDAETGGSLVGVVPLLEEDEKTPVLDNNGNQIYRRARTDEVANGKCVPIDVEGGVVTVVGFDNGIYWLQETKTPSGYTSLAGRQRFIINDANLDSIFNGSVYSTGSGVHVVNKSGTMLPETGAKGTAAFITFGVVVMLATGCLLVTRKRLSMIED